MKKKNSNKVVVPRKKTIRKPRFFRVFSLWLAACMIVSMTATFLLCLNIREKSLERANDKLEEYSDELKIRVKEYYEADESERDKYFFRLKDFLYTYAAATGEYCEIYVGGEKIMETKCGFFSRFVYFEDEGDQFDIPVYLEDDSCLAALASYKDGKYDVTKNYNRLNKYDLDYDAFRIALRYGLVRDIYGLYWESAYINEERHSFIPGRVFIYGLAPRDTSASDGKEEEGAESYGVVDTFEYPVVKTEGYKFISADKIGDPVLGYLDPEKKKQKEEGTCALVWYNEDYHEYTDSSRDFADRPWYFVSTSTYMTPSSVYDVLPVTSTVLLIAGTLLAVLAALVISAFSYNRKKAVWEVFEYRKKTTAAMAHDLKTPLAAMAAYAENLEYDIDSEKRAYYSSKVRENVASMNKTIEGILEFTKSETGVVKGGSADIDVRALIEKEIKATAGLFEKKGIKTDIKGGGHIKSSEELISQAVRNLIGNAVKYARPDTVFETVIDGKGFTMTNLTDQKIENVKDLKMPFVKGAESRGSESGAGLGLSIADNSLASAGHKLDIEVEGETFKAIVRW